MSGRRLDGYATATVNRRLVAVSGLFAFRAMHDPSLPSSVPKGREAQRFVSNEKTGLLAYLVRKPRPRSALRLREPRRLPRPLTVTEAAGLLASLRTWRDRAMARLMLYCADNASIGRRARSGACAHPAVVADSSFAPTFVGLSSSITFELSTADCI